MTSGNPKSGRFTLSERIATALRQEQEASLLLSAIVDSSEDAIISKDLTGRIMTWNQAAERIFGYTAEEAIGKSITILIPEDRQNEEPQILARLQRGERVDHFETIRRRKDGTLLHVSLTISPVKDRNGKIVGASKIARDVTQQKQIEEAIQALNSRLTADLAAMTRMQELSTRLIQAGAFSDLLNEILDAGIAITGAEMGDIQLIDGEGALRITSQRGFEAPFLQFFDKVQPGYSACGTALRRRERVIVEDVSSSPIYVGTPALRAMLEANVRAVQSTPLMSRSGRLLGVFSTHYSKPSRLSDRDLRLLDVLARQAADLIERKLSEEMRAQLSAIVESSGDAIYVYDLTGTVMSWNRGAEELYGYTEHEILGRRGIDVIVPPEFTAEVERVIDPAVLEGKTLRNFETKRKRRDGSIFPALQTISPVRDEAGNVTAVSVIARDITDQKRGEESYRETQKLESLGLLAGGIAHDFNNLLTGVLGYASLLADELPSGSAQSGMVQRLVDAAESMARLTSQMLAYSGRGHFLIEPVDLSNQVIQITSLIQSSIPRNVTLRLSLANDLPLFDADIGQLHQVIMNLVINAAEAIGAGAGTVELKTEVANVTEEQLLANVALTSPPPGEYVVVIVEDTGEGMDEATRSRIFDPFFTTKFTGRGLGLSSVLGIVRGHRGLITVDSRPGAGTRFRVFFPISRLSAPAAVRPSEARGNGTVLVVDDEDLVRRMAAAALQRLGYKVITAENGEEAVELFAKDPKGIDVVLLDMTMPVLDGDETLRRLREIRRDAVVLAMSGFHEHEARQRFGKGIAGFVQKPFTANQLGSKITTAKRTHLFYSQ